VRGCDAGGGSEVLAVPRRKSFREKWRAYAFYRDTRRYEFDLRHARLRWSPVLIAIAMVGTTGLALVLNAAVLSPGVNTYLLALLVADTGMALVEGMAVLIGRRLWKEDRDARYLGIAVGFAAMPAWGGLEALCVSYFVPALSTHAVCQATGGVLVFAFAWLIGVPVLVTLLDYRGYRGAKGTG